MSTQWASLTHLLGIDPHKLSSADLCIGVPWAPCPSQDADLYTCTWKAPSQQSTNTHILISRTLLGSVLHPFIYLQKSNHQGWTRGEFCIQDKAMLFRTRTNLCHNQGLCGKLCYSGNVLWYRHTLKPPSTCPSLPLTPKPISSLHCPGSPQ